MTHMYHRRARRATCIAATFTAAIVVTVSGCRDDRLSAPQIARNDQSPASIASQISPTDAHPYEAEDRAIAVEVPTFAGTWIDTVTGLAVAAVTTLRDSAAVATRVRAVVRFQSDVGHGRSIGRAVVVRLARYPFIDLARWRDSILFWREAVSVGIHSIDLDEVNNVVQIGVSRDHYMTAMGAVLRRVREIAADPGAIRVTAEAPVRLLRGRAPTAIKAFATNDSLTSRTRPLRGGVQGDAFPAGCTIGFIVKFDNVYYATMAAHCSRPAAVVTPLALGQGGESVAIEAIDPPPYDFWTPEWHYARWNESTLYQISNGISFDFGRVARPANSSGSLQIDAGNPYFQLTGEEQGGIGNGWQVFHVGIRDGWRYGTVYESCKDSWIPEDGYWVHCSFRASMSTHEGDSGGPVLAPYNGGYIAVGMVWGGTESGNGVFSGWRGLDMDLTRSFYSGRLFVR